jgi:Fe2+ transport system protein FeoA
MSHLDHPKSSVEIGQAPGGEVMPLDQLPVGRRAMIVALKEESAYLYLLRLGLVVGAEIELVRSLSRGSIRIFRVDNGELALRSEGARGITVRIEPA